MTTMPQVEIVTANVLRLLKALATDEERLEVINAVHHAFCAGCGTKQPDDWVHRCSCQNDE